MKKNLLILSTLLTLLTLSHTFASGVTNIRIPTWSQIPKITPEKKTLQWLVILNNYFAKDDKNLYVINDDKTGWKPLSGADYDTFRVMLGRFAQDKNTIFSLGDPLDGVDRKSFVVISGTHGYASDDVSVFGPQGRIEWANPETFRLYTGAYWADAGHVYYMGKRIDADSASFEVIDTTLYAKDAEKVFYRGKVLPGVPVDGFYVKWEQAFSRDGRMFVDGKVQTWQPIWEEDTPSELQVPDAPSDIRFMSWETLLKKIFPENGVLTPYKMFFSLELWFLLFLWLIWVAFFSAIFVFFAERNDESVTWMQVFFRTVFSLFLGGVVGYFVSFQTSLLVSAICMIVVFWGMFLILVRIGSVIKTLFVMILTLIATSFFAGLFIIAWRMTNITPQILWDFIARDTLQWFFIIASIGIFGWSWLIRTQLKMSPLWSVVSSFVATLFGVGTLVFIRWLWPLTLPASVIVFSLLFGAFTWILAFRQSSKLLLTSVRVLRITLLLGMMIYLLVFLIV